MIGRGSNVASSRLTGIFGSQAGQDARKNMAAPFVLILPDGTIGGYFTLSSTSIQLAELPAQTVRKFPRYPLVPATLLGRLAVDHRKKGKGYGRFLLADALYQFLEARSHRSPSSSMRKTTAPANATSEKASWRYPTSR